MAKNMATRKQESEKAPRAAAGMFPKLDGLSEKALAARASVLELELASDASREAIVDAIRQAAGPLLRLYMRGRTICPQCAGFVQVASSPRGYIRYHRACPTCGHAIQTDKLPKPPGLAGRRRR